MASENIKEDMEETKEEQQPAKVKGSGADHRNISEIGNRDLRQKQYAKLKREKKKDKKKRRQERQKHAEALGPENAPPKLVPKTIDSIREADETTVIVADGDRVPEDQQDEEVNWDIANDEFKDYFSKSYEPKVLITSADNPHSVSLDNA